MKFAVSLVALCALTACGGGGGGTTTASGGTAVNAAIPVIQPAPEVSTIVTAAKAAKYAAGSEELIAFNRLNAERNACGFGYVAQNAALDQAALAHANWQVANNTQTHREVAGTPYYTGVKSIDRVVAAGYVTYGNAVAEEITGYPTNAKAGFGEAGIRVLLNAPYHMVGLIGGFRDIGVSIRAADDLALAFNHKELQINLGFKPADGFQLLAPLEVATYPCDGTVGVVPNLAGETPNPVPGRDLFANPLGSSVAVILREGRDLNITSASMTNLANGQPITLRATLSAKNDPNAINGTSYFRSNQAVITPDAALPPMTRFQVMIGGTNNGVTFSRTFIFTTGATYL